MHEAVFHCLDDPFFGPKTPAPGHAVDTVLEEAELGLSGSSYVGLTCINLANSETPLLEVFCVAKVHIV